MIKEYPISTRSVEECTFLLTANGAESIREIIKIQNMTQNV